MYVTGKVLQWVEEQGGVEEMARRSSDKAKLVYSTADESDVRTTELASGMAIHSDILSVSSLCLIVISSHIRSHILSHTFTK